MKKFSLEKIHKNVDQDELICWVDIQLILEHLFSEKSFKVIDIESKFWIPRNQYNVLAKKLEQVWILKRWENNSRVLNEEYSKEQVMKAFLYAEWDIQKIQIHCELEEGTTSSFTRAPLNA